MANECLLTKLKGSVDNENLFKFNYSRIKCDIISGKTPTFYLGCSTSMTVKANKNIIVNGVTAKEHTISGKSFQQVTLTESDTLIDFPRNLCDFLRGDVSDDITASIYLQNNRFDTIPTLWNVKTDVLDASNMEDLVTLYGINIYESIDVSQIPRSLEAIAWDGTGKMVGTFNANFYATRTFCMISALEATERLNLMGFQNNLNVSIISWSPRNYNDFPEEGTCNALCDALYANGKHSGTLRIILGPPNATTDRTYTFTENGWS